jgi:hypothetical protein
VSDHHYIKILHRLSFFRVILGLILVRLLRFHLHFHRWVAALDFIFFFTFHFRLVGVLKRKASMTHYLYGNSNSPRNPRTMVVSTATTATTAEQRAFAKQITSDGTDGVVYGVQCLITNILFARLG